MKQLQLPAELQAANIWFTSNVPFNLESSRISSGQVNENLVGYTYPRHAEDEREAESLFDTLGFSGHPLLVRRLEKCHYARFFASCITYMMPRRHPDASTLLR